MIILRSCKFDTNVKNSNSLPLFFFTGKLTQCVFGHWDVVTCMAYSRHVGLTGGDALVVSGSRDATVLVWRWNERLQRVTASDRAEGEY